MFRSMVYLIIAVIGIAFIGVRLAASGYNKRVGEELNSAPNGEMAQKTMLITFPGGRHTPVNYLREGNTVFAGSDFNWWKSIAAEGTRLELLIRGEHLTGLAKVSQDLDYTYEVFERLRPDAPTWASRLVGAKLVVIELD